MTKYWKKIQLKKSLKYFFDQKLQFTYPYIKGIQATGEHPAKHEIPKLFSLFVGHFCPPGSGSASGQDPARIH